MTTYPKPASGAPNFPSTRTRRPDYWDADDTFRASIVAPRRCAGIRLLRRPAVRQRPAALRPPADRLRQGHRAALSHHARLQGGAPLRLGHPRPARRTRGAAPARHHRQGADRGDGHREVQRCLPRVGAQVHRGVARLRHPPGALGRLRQRLQDPRSRLHGVGDLGVQAAVGQGPGLRGQPGAAVLLERRDAAVQPRTADGRRRLSEPAGPGASRSASGSPTGPLAGAYLLVWTTTPWTLPSNQAVAVNPDVDLRAVVAGPTAALRARRGAACRLRARTRRRARGPRHLHRSGSAWHAVPAAVPVLHGRAQRLSGAARRLRHHRGRHRHRAHGARVRRGRQGHGTTPQASSPSPRSTPRADSTRRCPTTSASTCSTPTRRSSAT